MKLSSLITAVIAGCVIFFCISSSKKTSGTVSAYRTVELPEIDIESSDTPELSAITVKDLTLPQLFALDTETREIIQNETFENPEDTADWAVAKNREVPALKVLELVLSYWATQTPRTCIDWTENIPFNKYNLYKAVARAWANESPSDAAEWANEMKANAMKKAILKEIISLWAESNPKEASEWISESNSFSDEESLDYLYPTLMHAWFRKSPAALFTWRMAENDIVDLDSAFLVREWARARGASVLEWLKNIKDNRFAEELKIIVAHQLAESDPKLVQLFLARKDIENIKNPLLEAFIVKMAGKNTPAALSELEKLKTYSLRRSICVKAAMELAGKDRKAIEFVKAIGFLTFPRLNQFFAKWGTLDGMNAAEWLRTKSSIPNVSPHLMKYMIMNYNLANPEKQIKSDKVIKYLAQKDNYDASTSDFSLPTDLVQKFTSHAVNWNNRRERLLNIVIENWAVVKYTDCLIYIRQLEKSEFKNICMKAALSKTPQNKLNESFKMVKNYPDASARKDLFSVLAISTAAKSPQNAYNLLKSKGNIEVQSILSLIDVSIKSKRKELISVLEKIRGEYAHIFYPYFFYKYTQIDLNGARSLLSKYRSKPMYNSYLIATAAAYHDFHPRQSKNWLKSLKQNERSLVENILHPESSN